MIWKFLFCGLLAALLALGHANAESPQTKGYKIAKRAAAKDDGYRDFSAVGKMVLRTKSGSSSKRNFDFKSLERKSGDRTVLIFNWPGDIRNTALLTHSYKKREDDQWLYLPAKSRVRRVASSARSGSFVGSEFAYEDMVNQDVDKFTYKWIEDKSCPGSKIVCHVIDRFPKFSSGYTRQRVWLDKKKLLIRQIYYYDRRKAHLKTLRSTGYRKYKKKFWKAGKMVMSNKLTGKSTELTWRKFRFGRGLSSSAFSVSALRNLR